MTLFWALVTIVVVVLTPRTAMGVLESDCINGFWVDYGFGGGSCFCSPDWEGDMCDVFCVHGVVTSGRCTCDVGWYDSDCSAEDECVRKTSGCEHICTDTVASFTCTCQPGYDLDADGKSCTRVVSAEQVLILLDVSESLKDFLSEISGFIDTFYALTSTNAFFQNHKMKVTVATFNEGLVAGEQWILDYSQYNTADDLRNAETAEVNDIVTAIDAKEASGLTNIGKTLQDAMATYSLDQSWRVILVSDFLNRVENPTIADVLQQYSNDGIKTVPVIVDKLPRDERTYNDVKAGAVGEYGIELRQGFDADGVDAIFNL